MADIFISYKSDRRAAAEHLAEILADYGWSLWWDYALASGKDFGAQIERELRAARAVVVLWCTLSRESEWVKEEAALAKRLGTLVPVRIEPVYLPLGFSLSQTVDLSDWDGSPGSGPLRQLVAELERVTGRKARPNLDGLMRTERSWRRYGAPPLHAFALSRPVEPTAPAAVSSGTRPEDLRPPMPGSSSVIRPGRIAIAAVIAVAAIAVAARVIDRSGSPAEPPPAASANEVIAQPQELPPPDPPERKAYDQALAAKSSARYRRFLRDYPGSRFAADVRQRLATCSSSTVPVRPGRRVNSQADSIQGSPDSFQEAVRTCRAALEQQCESGVIEHVNPEQWGLIIPLRIEPTDSRNVVTSQCYATCFRTRTVETCD